MVNVSLVQNNRNLMNIPKIFNSVNTGLKKLIFNNKNEIINNFGEKEYIKIHSSKNMRELFDHT